jgi:hypothetical protein
LRDARHFVSNHISEQLGAAQAPDSALTAASIDMKWKNGWSAAASSRGEFYDVATSYAASSDILGEQLFRLPAGTGPTGPV